MAQRIGPIFDRIGPGLQSQQWIGPIFDSIRPGPSIASTNRPNIRQYWAWAFNRINGVLFIFFTCRTESFGCSSLQWRSSSSSLGKLNLLPDAHHVKNCKEVTEMIAFTNFSILFSLVCCWIEVSMHLFSAVYSRFSLVSLAIRGWMFSCILYDNGEVDTVKPATLSDLWSILKYSKFSSYCKSIRNTHSCWMIRYEFERYL